MGPLGLADLHSNPNRNCRRRFRSSLYSSSVLH